METKPIDWNAPEHVAHRERCRDLYGPGCCCAEYAAVTGALHPDCPEHGHAEVPRRTQEPTR